MAMKELEFEIFGLKYKTKQFSAIEGLKILDELLTVHPTIILRQTQIFHDENWINLDYHSINNLVKDFANAVSPRMALKVLTSHVSDINFGFLDNWKVIQVPSRFLSNAKTVKVEGIEPIVSTLVQEGVASIRELEEYYSIEDAYRMFDIIMSKAVNNLLGQEEAEREAKRS